MLRLLSFALLGLFAFGTAASNSRSIDVASTLGVSEGSIAQTAATCDGITVHRRTVYFDASNLRRRDCDGIWPSQLDTNTFTDIVLAFAVFDPDTFAVGLQHPDDEKVYEQLLALPQKNHKGIAIGGSSMPKGGAAWSNMASTQANRKAFIDSLKQFLEKWKFTSIEVHWQWPGGADTQNQVSLMREMRDGLGKDFGITVVVPPQDEHLKNMDLKGMEKSVHWFTVLTFDLHGWWDTSKIKPHTDLAEIDSALNRLLSANLAPRRVNLGLANYGRGFTVADKACMYYGCENTGPSKAGSCTKEEGVLSACEIARIIEEKNLTPQIIKGGAGVKEISWDDQWIGYDDADTLALKLEMANKHCLGGSSLWAIDYSQCNGKSGPPQLPGSSSALGPSLSASSKDPSSAASSRVSATRSPVVSTGQPPPEVDSSGSAPTNARSSVRSSASDTLGFIVTTSPDASNFPLQSSADGSSATGSSAVGSSGVASSTNDGPSTWSGTASGSELSFGSPISSTGTYSGSPSSGVSGIPAGSASSSVAWGSSISTAPSSGSQESSQVGSSTVPNSSAVNSSGGSLSSQQPTSVQGSSTVSDVPASPIVSSSEPSPTAPHDDSDSDDDPNSPSDSDSDGDPDSHSDSDPNCKPNDCVKDCVAWNLITFLATKRPFCPCVPKCDQDGDSDSPSDSDDDDPEIKPVPTSIPKEKNPECKLFGCGCGWMGLGFGPGCPGKDIDIDIPCGLFGCDPCIFFGCPGINPKGLVGYNGYCLGEGCDPCPTELCKRPDCTIPGGCGPKPGPAPIKPADLPDPVECDDSQRTIITERFVWCTEGFNVSALPSSMRETSSTMISSMCLPMIDATVTVCGGAMPGFDTTTTQTGKNTLTSDAPACTRAPLSLDDDEGNNNPEDPLSLSSTYASNTTTVSSTKIFSSSKSSSTKTSSSSKSSSIKTSSSSKSSSIKTSSSSKSSSTKTSSSSKSSSTSISTKTSFAPPYPSLKPMDKKGRWKVKLNQYMNREHAEVKWQLFDPNGNHAGGNTVSKNGVGNLHDIIKTINRPFEHQMPFGVTMIVLHARNVEKCVIYFQFAEIWGCDKPHHRKPQMMTENYFEELPFQSLTRERDCNDGITPPLVTGDLWCTDLNDADWYPSGSGWRRDFECGWKGYRPADSDPL